MEGPIVLNFFAGPGCGKSTMRASVFSELKWLGVDCEEVTEFAKDLTWEERFGTLANQDYIFGKQSHRVRRLASKVRVILSDSPLPFSAIYDKSKDPTFCKHVLDVFNSYYNVNYFINRCKGYNPNGRNQTLEQAIKVDMEIYEFLKVNGIPFTQVDGIKENVQLIVLDIMERLEHLDE